MNQVAGTLPQDLAQRIAGMETDELAEWFECLDDVALRHGDEQVQQLLEALQGRASRLGINRTAALNTPYINTITADDQPDYPGDGAIERRIRSLVRW
ncbi:MAG: hypothetical protein KDA71_11640, partial [Planctomycetales bacterium]|nr:hypothetical protein [Planctomycetales bacterium]